MQKTLIFEGITVVFSLTQPPWHSITEYNLKILISEFSGFNRKLSSLEKLSVLQELSSSTWSHYQRAINSKHPLRPRWHISSYSLTTTENWMYAKERIFMDPVIIYKLLDPQLHLPLQVSALIILVLHIPPTIIQKLYSRLLKLSTFDWLLFANAVE